MVKKKEKILIVHNYYQIPGGEDRVVVNERKMLEDHGHEVVLYTRDNSELKKMGRVEKCLLPITTIFNRKTYKEIRRIIYEQKISIVHVHNTLNLISPSVYYSALSMKIPVVQTIHNFRLLCPGATFYRDGNICEDCVSQGLRCAIRHSCYRGSKLQTAACVINTKIHRIMGIYGKISYICLTDFNKQKLLSLKQIKREKIFVKPNFAEEISEFVPGEQRANQFVFAGRLDKLKGIELLLKAWKEMGTKAPKLVICGIGPLEKWCERFIEKNKINVDMLGFIPNEKMKRLVANSKALILPTQWYEGFPMTIVEAFSVGTPVICSDLGNAGSIVINGINGYKFAHTSYIQLLEAIRKIDMEIYQKTFQDFQNKYSEEINYKILRKIYSTITDDKF